MFISIFSLCYLDIIFSMVLSYNLVISLTFISNSLLTINDSPPTEPITLHAILLFSQFSLITANFLLSAETTILDCFSLYRFSSKLFSFKSIFIFAPVFPKIQLSAIVTAIPPVETSWADFINQFFIKSIIRP